MPEIEQVRKEFSGQAVGFLALSITSDPGRVRAAASHLGVEMPVALSDQPMLAPFGFHSVPSTILVAADGTITGLEGGERDRAFFEQRVKQLLQ